MPKGKTTNASAPSTAPSSSTNPSSKDANVDLASTPKVAGSDNQPLGSTASTQPTTREKNQAPTTAPTSSPSAGSGPSQVDQLGLIQKIEELEGMQVQLSDAQRAKAEKSALAAYDSYITQLKPITDPAARAEALLVHLKTVLAESHTQQMVATSWQEKYQRMVLLKERMESLCRDQQTRLTDMRKQNAVIIETEHKARETMKLKFEESLGDISASTAKLHEDMKATITENIDLKDKLKRYLQYDQAREEHDRHLQKTNELEKRLLEAKLKEQTELRIAVEKALVTAKVEVEQRQKTQEEMRTEISKYSNHFATLQSDVKKMTDLINSYKREADRLKTQLTKTEAERDEAKSLLQTANLGLLESLTSTNVARQNATDAMARYNELEAKHEKLKKMFESLLKSKQSASTPTPGTSTPTAAASAPETATADAKPDTQPSPAPSQP